MINVEIKARSTEVGNQRIREWLKSNVAVTFKGLDHQTDTYFVVPHGRLKLREGNIENCLIQYDRPDQSGPKVSKYKLVYFQADQPIKEALVASLGVLTIVAKEREIFYLSNVKIHLDRLIGFNDPEERTRLYFVEIEARDEQENIGMDRLNEQTETLMGAFEIKHEDLITDSYSDMALRGK